MSIFFKQLTQISKMQDLVVRDDFKYCEVHWEGNTAVQRQESGRGEALFEILLAQKAVTENEKGSDMK